MVNHYANRLNKIQLVQKVKKTKKSKKRKRFMKNISFGKNNSLFKGLCD